MRSLTFLYYIIQYSAKSDEEVDEGGYGEID